MGSRARRRRDSNTVFEPTLCLSAKTGVAKPVRRGRHGAANAAARNSVCVRAALTRAPPADAAADAAAHAPGSVDKTLRAVPHNPKHNNRAQSLHEFLSSTSTTAPLFAWGNVWAPAISLSLTVLLLLFARSAELSVLRARRSSTAS